MFVSYQLSNLSAVTCLAAAFNTALQSVSDNKSAKNNYWVIYLSGQLGVGKTTLVQQVLAQMGYTGRVKSPSYTIVESYDLDQITVHHFDLYRITDAQELYYLGMDDYFSDNTVAFIEWPEQGQPDLPAADIVFQYHMSDTSMRNLVIKATSAAGEQLLAQLERKLK